MITAGKFATPGNPRSFKDGQECFFRFGIDATNAAAELRRLAEAIEQQRVVIQTVQTGAVAELDDYSLEAIMITFAERELVEVRDAVALFGPGSPFPVAVVT